MRLYAEDHQGSDPQFLQLSGKIVAAEAIETDFLERYPVRYIETYEDKKLRDSGPDEGEMTDQLREKLKSLGYIS